MLRAEEADIDAKNSEAPGSILFGATGDAALIIAILTLNLHHLRSWRCFEIIYRLTLQSRFRHITLSLTRFTTEADMNTLPPLKPNLLTRRHTTRCSGLPVYNACHLSSWI